MRNDDYNIWTATAGPRTRMAAVVLGILFVAGSVHSLYLGVSLLRLHSQFLFGTMLLVIGIRGRLGPKRWGSGPKDPEE
jgi:hypothetical protein